MEKSVRDIMQEISHDPRINPDTMNIEELHNKGLSDEEIKELLKLQHIYKELESEKTIDNSLLVRELNEVVDDIRRSAEHSRLEGLDDPLEKKLHDAMELKEIAAHLDESKD